MKTKTCPKCKTEYPATLEYFYRNKHHKYGLNCWCKKCQWEYKQTEEGRQAQRKHHQSEKYQQYQQEYAKRPEVKQARRKSRLKRNFGLTDEQVDKMSETQGGLCAICGQPETVKYKGIVKRLAVDHDHKTGRIRGLLCIRCNLVVGFIDSNPEILEKVKIYLGELK